MPKLTLDLPLPADRKLSQAEFRRVERFLEEWKAEVQAAAKRHPRKSYDLGVEQVNAFLRLMTRMANVIPPQGFGPGPTTRAGIGWLETYTLHELDGALNRYIDDIKSALLYGMRGVVNPTEAARMMYHATRDGEVNWRMVARTEMIRANAEGRLATCLAQGYEQVWAPPHMGACKACKRLLENRPFAIEEVRGVSNFGRAAKDWVACIPLHPHCRHAWVPYIPEVFEETMRQVQLQEDMGLTEDRLNEMFDESGQLKPEFENAVDWSAFKALDPYQHALAVAIEKVADGRSGMAVAKDIMSIPEPTPDEDELLWQGGHLRDGVRDRIVRWREATFGGDARGWMHLLLGDRDVVQLVVDYVELREVRPEWAALTAPELHAAIATVARGALEGAEIAPGRPLDVYVRPEATLDVFIHDARVTGTPLYDVGEGAWLVERGLPLAEVALVERVASPDGATLEKVAPDYRWDDVAKAKGESKPTGGKNYTPGVEHWITIHPHGEDEKGIPVLVRNNADGTMSVIGGAGGHLNYLRLDPKKRREKKRAVDEKTDQKADEKLDTLEHGEGPLNVPEAARDPEAVAREEEEAQQRIHEHREKLAKVQEQQRELRSQLQGYVASMYNDVAGQADNALAWDDLSDKQRARALKAVKFSALHQAAFGQLDAADKNASPLVVTKGDEDQDPADATLDKAVSDEQRNELEENGGEEPPEETPTQRAAKIVALTDEQAEQVNRLVAELGILGKQAANARKVIGGDTKVSDAMALDYSEADVEEAVRARVNAEKRTQVARAIFETMDSRGSKKLTQKAMAQGGYDTVDTFAQAVLGQSAIDPAVGKLLGVGGMAQLIAAKLHGQAKAGEVDLDAAYEALDELTHEREVYVASRARARALRAAAEAQQAREARKVSGQTTDPEGLYTETLSRSIETKKLNEAASSLGMAVAGLEAASALKVAMREQAKGAASHVRIGGFPAPAHIKQLGQKVGVEIGDADITRESAGNYTLKLPVDRLDHLFAAPAQVDQTKRQRLENIRTGKDLDDEIEANRQTPGMTDTLSPAQAKGKMFLLEAGKGAVLGFAPGVGKTHTAIAAAMQKMHEGKAEGRQHRALVVAPAAVAREWRDTVMNQGGSYSAQVLGAQFDDAGDNASADVMRGKDWKKQLDSPADFNVVSYELLAKNPDLAERLGCTIRICDEIQKAKNESSLNFKALHSTSDRFDHAWNLTGTAIEKNTGDLHSALQTSAGGMGSRAAFREKWDKVAQFEHVTAEDRIRQFREGISDKAFFLDANDAGNDLPPKNEGNEDGFMHEVKVDLSGAHKELLRQKVQWINEEQASRRARREAGEDVKPLPFGGRGAIANALMKADGLDPKDHAIVQKVADLCMEHEGDHYDGSRTGGQHAGHYDGKTVVFAEEVGHLRILREELAARGIQVFEGHSSKMMDGSDRNMSNAENSKQIQEFLAHGGKAVLLTSDKNNAGINLQLGVAKGKFQHGATRMVHLTRPINNARLQQREARIHRRGSVASVNTFHVTADTPYERSDADRLAQERRTQDLAGNVEDRVRTTSGEKVETVRHRYQRRGGRVPDHEMEEEK